MSNDEQAIDDYNGFYQGIFSPDTVMKDLIQQLYFDKKTFNDIAAQMHKPYEKIKNEENLIEIFKSCIREYASHLLQELTPENFKQVQYLWEIHYRIEALSLKTEQLYQLYFSFYQTKTPISYDFNQLHFDIAKDIKSDLFDSRKVHKQYKQTHMKIKPTLVRVLQDQSVQLMQQHKETNKAKSPIKPSQPVQRQKEKPPMTVVSNIRNEYKEFEERLSKLEINTNKLEPTFSTQWLQKFRNLVLKRKK